MKMLKILILMACTTIIIACHKANDNTVSGVYVTAFKNEFTVTDDTLILEVYNLESQTFKVKEHSGYHRIREGKILPKKFEQENWMATFNKDNQVLQETAFGRQIYVNTTAGTLSFGSIYHKIK